MFAPVITAVRPFWSGMSVIVQQDIGLLGSAENSSETSEPQRRGVVRAGEGQRLSFTGVLPEPTAPAKQAELPSNVVPLFGQRAN